MERNKRTWVVFTRDNKPWLQVGPFASLPDAQAFEKSGVSSVVGKVGYLYAHKENDELMTLLPPKGGK